MLFALLLSLNAFAQDDAPIEDQVEEQGDAERRTPAEGDDAEAPREQGDAERRVQAEGLEEANEALESGGEGVGETIQENLEAAGDAVQEGVEQAADAVEESADQAAETVEDVKDTDIVGSAQAEAGQTYRDGYEQGKADAKRAGHYGLHGLAGAAGGCVAGPCGCIAVPAGEALILPAVPNGPWRAESNEYQQGYIEGYQRSVQRRRMVYSFAGASIGTVVAFGAGVAVGVLL